MASADGLTQSSQEHWLHKTQVATKASACTEAGAWSSTVPAGLAKIWQASRNALGCAESFIAQSRMHSGTRPQAQPVGLEKGGRHRTPERGALCLGHSPSNRSTISFSRQHACCLHIPSFCWGCPRARQLWNLAGPCCGECAQHRHTCSS